MQFAYLTRDEVNQELALAFAAEHDVNLEVYARFDGIVGQDSDAVLCDLDSFPAEERKTNLATLAMGSKCKPIALHSYNLDDEQRRLLHHNGVLTARRLRGVLFSRLLATLRQGPSTQTVA
jgi:hypothetical protein